MESGIDESAVRKFPGSEVTVGSAASGAGDNREIPVEEGGDISRVTGQYVLLPRSRFIFVTAT